MRTIRSFQTADNRVCVWIQGLGYFNKLCTEIKSKEERFFVLSGVNVFIPELTLALSLIFYLYIALNLDQRVKVNQNVMNWFRILV